MTWLKRISKHSCTLLWPRRCTQPAAGMRTSRQAPACSCVLHPPVAYLSDQCNHNLYLKLYVGQQALHSPPGAKRYVSHKQRPDCWRGAPGSAVKVQRQCTTTIKFQTQGCVPVLFQHMHGRTHHESKQGHCVKVQSCIWCVVGWYQACIHSWQGAPNHVTCSRDLQSSADRERPRTAHHVPDCEGPAHSCILQLTLVLCMWQSSQGGPRVHTMWRLPAAVQPLHTTLLTWPTWTMTWCTCTRQGCDALHPTVPTTHTSGVPPTSAATTSTHFVQLLSQQHP